MSPRLALRLPPTLHPLALWRLLRHSADIATPAGRARDRHRRIVLSAAAAATAKLVTIATSLISVPLTLHYLGPEQYGMWMVISAFTVMLSFADMGLGNGILNAVARDHGAGDRAAIRAVVASGYVVLAGIAILLLAGFAIAYPLVPWYRLFNAATPAAREQAAPALAAFVACFALAIPLSLVQKVQIGLQQGFANSLWQALGSVMTLVAVLLVIRAEGRLPLLVLALAGTPLLATALNTGFFFTRHGADLRPAPALASPAIMIATMRVGLLFFVLQLVAATAFGADTVIIAQVDGAAAVAQYAVPERMFAIIGMLLAMALAPLWPAYGEAIVRGDRDWVRRTLRRSLLLAAGASAAMAIVLVIAGPTILRHWVGQVIQPSFALLLGLGLWRVVEACGNGISLYLNGANLMRQQVGIAVVTGIVMVALKVALVHRIGAAGIPWAANIAFVLCSGIPLAIVVRRHLAPRA